jgi:hypothetical protein
VVASPVAHQRRIQVVPGLIAIVVGGLEPWIAAQPWRPAPGGWQLSRALDGWRFRLQPIEDGLRVTAGAPGGAPAVWLLKG